MDTITHSELNAVTFNNSLSIKRRIYAFTRYKPTFSELFSLTGILNFKIAGFPENSIGKHHTASVCSYFEWQRLYFRTRSYKLKQNYTNLL